MTYLSEDEKIIVYSVLDMEYHIGKREAYQYVESYVRDPTKILRLVAKDIACDVTNSVLVGVF